MSFRSMFQDVREAMDSVHLSVGAVGRGLAERGEGGGLAGGMLRVVGTPPTPREVLARPSIPSAGLPEREDTGEPGEVRGEGCECLLTPVPVDLSLPWSPQLGPCGTPSPPCPDFPLASPGCRCC